jgi:hypothetical protein
VGGDVVKFIDPRTGKEVARVAAPFANSSVKLFEARLENDTLVLVDPGSGGEVARVKVRFVESVRVDRVDRVPEVPAPAGVKYYRAKLVGDQLLVIDEVANETFVSKIGGGASGRNGGEGSGAYDCPRGGAHLRHAGALFC